MSAGQDAKFFTRGKIQVRPAKRVLSLHPQTPASFQEFRQELQDAELKDKKFVKRKTVLKKIVANITMGNDMSPLYADVVQCLSVPSLDIKKMVYLFLVSYGRSKPEQIRYALPSLQQDCNDRDPLVRALAIRTMSYIPLPAVTKAMIDPLRHCLQDKDPYVRKTAAMCVAKIASYDLKILEKEEFFPLLKDLLLDPNPVVVANAVAALTELSEKTKSVSFGLDLQAASKLVVALADCSEWGQIYILDSLLTFVPQSTQDAEILTERIVVRLQSANSAVVLTTIKVLLYLMNYMDDRRAIEVLCRKMGPPLVTLLSSGPEVQYVALRNILLIIQRRPTVLRNDVKAFFCKYNDPIYVKIAKMECMYRLARDENAHAVLAEFVEYASEVDLDFMRRAVRSIGRLAIKIESLADKCIEALLDLIASKVSYVLQEAIIVIKDIFRRYPGKYEGIIPTLCENLDALDEPEAKAAMVWIIGQYANRIENADELLDDLLYTFLEESIEVQLALLTASVKLFIHKSTSETAKNLVHKVLKWTTEEIDNPDLRDRGFMYWRLLAINPAAAAEVVLCEKPAISTDTDRMERGALDQLLLHTGSLSSIYHKNPETFIRNVRGKALTDSPALNEASRKVLISLPPETHLTIETEPPPLPSRNAHPQSPSLPPLPSATITPTATAGLESAALSPDRLLNNNDEEDEQEDESSSDEGDAGSTNPNHGKNQMRDPYADLDGAFGSYLNDEPKPLEGRRLDDDLLL
ncbi:Adaptor protein complex beta subunit [Sistotremastrum niveocremeum HHB9708]|uniref:AP complex subunit beta n=2 Tax=Sistotremastraceae TaxID=3402574 RepID=A0A165AML2_9AGAM|nr:Adaptor protein complex beta subunit [Sistotremastrum niveocremeum HHB9708]KZT42115.1 Adaptor protein complex beta subunit [Sistotremastrum suecicum HHB10207 ss-3]